MESPSCYWREDPSSSVPSLKVGNTYTLRWASTTASNPNVAIMGIEDSWLKHHGMTQDEIFGDFYFNSGVFVCFYDQWKLYDLNQVLLNTISQVDHSESCVRDSLYDQDILNIVSAKNKGLVDKTFNCQINPAPNGPSNDYYRMGRNHKPKIIHFIGGAKPFDNLGKIKFDILNMADSNANLGYIDSVLHYYYLYYFVQNQRKIWEKNS
jgi:lipopolysaccharide biosynthesis glycosyltransferase